MEDISHAFYQHMYPDHKDFMQQVTGSHSHTHHGHHHTTGMYPATNTCLYAQTPKMHGLQHYNPQATVGFLDGTTQLTSDTNVGLSPPYGTLPVGVTNINNIPAHMSTTQTGGTNHPWPHHHGMHQSCGIVQQFASQPPPAHQSSTSPQGQQTSGRMDELGCKSEKKSPGFGEEAEDDRGPQLKFPWMKTTKSHAHQWKAGWAGEMMPLLDLFRYVWKMFSFLPFSLCFVCVLAFNTWSSI